MGFLLFLLPLFSAPPASAGEASGPSGGDTAGARLGEVWRQARVSLAGAILVEISGRTSASGTVVCDPADPFQDGWRYRFQSPRTREVALMAECQGRIAGPLLEMRDGASAPLGSVEGSFLDSDGAMRSLASAGVSLDPRDYRSGGKRPFSLKLSALSDRRFPDPKPVLWTVAVGGSSFEIDAVKRRRFDPREYGVDLEDLLPPREKERREANLASRPAKPGVFSARSDLDKVLEYSRRKLPGARLWAVEGIVDAWGGSACLGGGDGWAYYFFSPGGRSRSVLFSCKGRVGPGSSGSVPVSSARHQGIDGPFVDSTRVLDELLRRDPSAMNETLNRPFSRSATLRLVNYRLPPYREPAYARTTQFWELQLGRAGYTFDAKSGRLLFIRE